jgi:hypothetical protein
VSDAETTTLYRCPRCKGTPRPKSEWATRYGIITCGTCLQQGCVILPDALPSGPPSVPHEAAA